MEHNNNEELLKYLKDIDLRLQNIENTLKLNKSSIFIDSNVVVDIMGIEKLAEVCQTNENYLYNIFHIEDNDIRLLIDFKDEKPSESQFKAALLILTAYNFCFGIKTIESLLLNTKLKLLGIKSLQNISANLKRYRKFIITEGKKGSSNFKYKITIPGINEGTNLIKELIKEK